MSCWMKLSTPVKEITKPTISDKKIVYCRQNHVHTAKEPVVYPDISLLSKTRAIAIGLWVYLDSSMLASPQMRLPTSRCNEQLSQCKTTASLGTFNNEGELEKWTKGSKDQFVIFKIIHSQHMRVHKSALDPPALLN